MAYIMIGCKYILIEFMHTRISRLYNSYSIDRRRQTADASTKTAYANEKKGAQMKAADEG